MSHDPPCDGGELKGSSIANNWNMVIKLLRMVPVTVLAAKIKLKATGPRGPHLTLKSHIDDLVVLVT